MSMRVTKAGAQVTEDLSHILHAASHIGCEGCMFIQRIQHRQELDSVTYSLTATALAVIGGWLSLGNLLG